MLILSDLLSSNYFYRPTRLALAVLVISLIINAVIGVSIILVGDFDGTDGKVLMTATSLAIFSIISLPSFFHIERRRYVHLSVAGIITALILYGLVVLAIWGKGSDNEILFKTIASLGILAIGTNHALLMLIATPTNILISICQRLTLGIIVIVGAILQIVVWTEEMHDMMARILGVLVIIDVLGTILVPMLSRMFRTPVS